MRAAPQALRQLITQLRQITRILWVRVGLLAALSLLTALAAPIFGPVLPDNLKSRFSEEAVLPVLTILANTMLAVATFSLGVMVSSHRSLAANTTPRIHRLLMEDTSMQSTLATFIGAFVFSLFSIILLRAGYYNDDALIIVFLATVLLVIAIVFSLIRWIYKLSRIGSVDYALERAEGTARETMRAFRNTPTFGASELDADAALPSDARSVFANASGFLRAIDISKLQRIGAAQNSKVYIRKHPGDRILKGHEIAQVVGDADEAEIETAFAIGAERSYHQDPRYALETLRETASRALSPGVNDPGTAVAVITRLELIWHDYFCAEPNDEGDTADRVFITPLSSGALIELSFREVSRDGAGFREVLTTILRALKTLEETEKEDARKAVENLKKELGEYAQVGLTTDSELAHIRTQLDQSA